MLSASSLFGFVTHCFSAGVTILIDDLLFGGLFLLDNLLFDSISPHPTASSFSNLSLLIQVFQISLSSLEGLSPQSITFPSKIWCFLNILVGSAFIIPSVNIFAHGIYSIISSFLLTSSQM